MKTFSQWMEGLTDDPHSIWYGGGDHKHRASWGFDSQWQANQPTMALSGGPAAAQQTAVLKQREIPTTIDGLTQRIKELETRLAGIEGLLRQGQGRQAA